MKHFKFIALIIIALSFGSVSFGAISPVEEIKTAEDAFRFAANMDPFDAEIFQTEIEGLSAKEKVKLLKISIEDIERAELSEAGGPTIGYYILAVLLPPAAVGIYTDWSMPTTLYSVAWTMLAWVPGIIHAFIVLSR